MTLPISNMLEVVEIIASLEHRIEELKELEIYFPCTERAIMGIYNQFKVTYQDYLTFKY